MGITGVTVSVAMRMRMVVVAMRVTGRPAIPSPGTARDDEAASGQNAVIVSDKFAGDFRQGGSDALQHAGFLVRKSIEKGGGEHVAGDAAEGVQMNLHGRSCSLSRHRRERTQHRSESSGGKRLALETEGRSDGAQSARIWWGPTIFAQNEHPHGKDGIFPLGGVLQLSRCRSSRSICAT